MNRNQVERTHQGAFTLLELLVVITIITILMSALLVPLSKGATKARYARWLGLVTNNRADSAAIIYYPLLEEVDGDILENMAGAYDQKEYNVPVDTESLNGIIKGGVAWSDSRFGPAIAKKSLQFIPALNGHIDCGNEIVLDRDAQLTLEAWIIVAGHTGASQGIITKANSNSPWDGISFFVNDGLGLRFTLSSDSSNQITVATGNNTVPLNKWIHVIATYDGSSTSAGMKIYVNGQEQVVTASGALTGTVRNSYSISIASFNGNGLWFNGAVDEAAVYLRALSASEIHAHHKAGSS